MIDHKFRFGKTDSRYETWIEWSEPIFDPTSEIGSHDSEAETRIWSEHINTWSKIFYKIAYFFMTIALDQKLIDSKSIRTEVHQTQTELTKNVT